MKYAIIMYGQFRSFEINLKKNLQEIKNSILNGNIVDIYIGTDNGGNYSKENALRIINIFKEFNCNVKKIWNWNNFPEWLHKQEKIHSENYNKQCKHSRGKHPFTSNLWFRRYVINDIVNKYIAKNSLTYDLHMSIRLFDTKIRKNLSDEIIKKKLENSVNNNKLLTSVDTIFIGTKDIIDKVFLFGKEMKLYHDDIWNNSELHKIWRSWDFCLSGGLGYNPPTYCSEIQIFSHIFHTIKSYENIRFDFNNPNSIDNKSTLFHVRLCNKRHRVGILNVQRCII